MRIQNSTSIVLLLVIVSKLTIGDLLVDKSRSRKNCTAAEIKSCLPGRCRVAPRSSPELYTCDCPRTSYPVRNFRPKKTPLFTVRCVPLPYNPCVVCHEKNTITCIQVTSKQVVCQCYSEYSASTKCFEKRDPCSEVPEGASISGNKACNVDEGNLCIPYLGTDKYTCICLRPFKASITLGFPNCLGEPEKTCDRQLCVGFQPVTPKGTTITPRRMTFTKDLELTDEVHATCVGNGTCKCPENWYGEHCTRWKGSPQKHSWSTWSPCHPDCLDKSILSAVTGVSGVGYRASKTHCTTGETRHCEGMFKIWSRCKVTSLCTDDSDNTKTFSEEVALAATRILKQQTDEVRTIIY